MPKKKTALAPRQKAALSPYQDHAYINPDGTVDGEKLLTLIRNTPGAMMLIIAQSAIQKKNPIPEHDLARTVEGVANLSMLATYGDEDASKQLKAIDKLIRPAKYELPFSKIQELVDRYETSPSLARGWELRRIMSNLCSVVEPKKKNPPHTPDQPIHLSQSFHAVYVSLADLARQHLKKNSTLQSVAISIYLEHLQKEGVTDKGSSITEKTLKRDLAEVRKWETITPEEVQQRRGRWTGGGLGDGEAISWCEFSEGWKKRTKTRGSRKQKLITGSKQ